jgi:hypothetical protein
MSDENLEKPKWSFNWKLALLAWAFFIGSLFMPFYHQGLGIFWMGWDYLHYHHFTSFEMVKRPWWFIERFIVAAKAGNGKDLFGVALAFCGIYVPLANLFMLTSPVLTLNRIRRRPGLLHCASMVAALFLLLGSANSMYWLIALGGEYFVRYRMGYYLWVISFGLLALSIRENKVKQES